MVIALGLALLALGVLMARIAWQNIQYNAMLADLQKAQNAKCKEPTSTPNADGEK